MDAYTRALMVKELQRERLAEAEARRLARRAPRPAVRGYRARLAHGWPRCVLAQLANVRYSVPPNLDPGGTMDG